MAALDTGNAECMGMCMVFGVGWPAAAVAIGAAEYMFHAGGVGEFLLVLVERKKPQSLC